MPQDQAGDRMNGALKALPIPIVVALLAAFGAYYTAQMSIDDDIQSLELMMNSRLSEAVGDLNRELTRTQINVAENNTELRNISGRIERLTNRCEDFLERLRHSGAGGP